MICYFANRRMEILAHASTQLKKGLHIKDDKKVENVESGQDVFSGYLRYGDGQRGLAERAADVGNYILKKSDDTDEVYTIIEAESDPLHKEIYFYAEAAGLDLIGEVCEPFEASTLMTLSEYAEKWLYDTGFEVGVDESEGVSKMLKWEDAETTMERILSTAEYFGCEVSFRYSVKRFSIKHKYVNFHKKRGNERYESLRRGRDFEDIRIKKSIADVATALRVTGGTPDGAGIHRESDGTYTWVKFSEYADGRDEENNASLQDDSEGMQFIGISPGHATDEESEDPDQYLWGMIAKNSGIIAVPSVQGHLQMNKVPKTGQALYTWIMFATDENGANMSDQPDDRSYIGFAYNHTTPNKKTLPSYYTWCPMDSKKAGRDIFISPGQGSISEGDGLYTWLKFADSAEGMNMSDSPANKTYIGLAYHKTSPTKSLDPADYEWQSITIGTQDGGFCLFDPSYPGLRQTDGTFIWAQFASDGFGNNMAGAPNNRPYLGIAYDKLSPIQSTDPADYEWSLIDADETQEVTLKGMNYNDGDFWVDSAGRLRSEVALARWSRYVSPDETGTDVGHIVAEFESDATNQQQLLEEAIEELKRRREPETTYDIELIKKPDWLEIGDTVPIVDPDGNLYLTARLIKLERSAENGKYTATFGEYVRESASLSDQVADLARRQRENARTPKYQWIVYADSPTGDGIRLRSDDAMYMGVAYNKVSPLPDLSDPFEYTWMRIGSTDGTDGEDAVTIVIIPSDGTVFKTSTGSKTLTAHVFKGNTELTESDVTALGSIYWYKGANSTTRLNESHSMTLTVQASDVNNFETYEARLEA